MQSFRTRVSKLLVFAGLLLVVQFNSGQLQAQQSITTTSAYTQNFDGFGTSATQALPTGWKAVMASGVSAYSVALTATAQAAGTTGTGVVSTGGGIYNMVNGVLASGTDHSLGLSGSSNAAAASPGYIFFAITNNTGSTLTGFTVAWDYEINRTSTRQFDWGMQTSTDGATFSSDITGSTQTYTAVAVAAVQNPPVTTSKSVTLTGLSIANGANYYFRWSYTGLGGSTNGQNISIDNVSITPSNAVSSIAITNTSPAAGTPSPGTSNLLLQTYNLAVTVLPTSITGLTVTTAGTYSSSDITALKCWYSTSPTFNAGTATLLSTKSTSLGAGSQVFPSFTSQSISAATTGYLFITADIASGATLGNTINIASNAFSNFTLSTGTKTGTDPVPASNSQTFTNVAATQLAVTGIIPTTPYAGSTGFSVIVQAQNGTGTAANVSANTAFTLSTNGSAGAIGGTTTGTLLAGTNTFTVTGVTLASAGTGATITATRSSGDVLTAGTSSTFNVLTLPSVAISNTSPVANNIGQSSTNVLLQTYNLAVTNNPVTLSGLTITTAGTYSATDITNLKCWYSTSSTFSSSTATLLSTKTTSLGSGSQLFPTFIAQSLPVGTGYIYITTDLAAAATVGNTINVASTAFSNFTFSSSALTGTNPVAAASSMTFALATDPLPFDLSTGSYTFTTWASTSPAATYPPNMYFHLLNATSPSVTATAAANYTSIYSSGSGTRITGQNANGVSLVNTSTGDNLGEIVVALNTTNRANIQVSWTAGTVAAVLADRDCRLRAQYKVGYSGTYTDLPNTSISQIEYLGAQTAGTSSTYGAITLPSSCENQPFVEVRWIYYFVSGANTRPEIRLDDITISSTPFANVAITSTSPAAANVSPGVTNRVLQTYNLAVTTADAVISGLTVTTAGTYIPSDLTSIKCWYSTSPTFSTGTATLLSTKTSSLGAGSQVFPTFTNQTISNGTTGYIFVTADIASGATNGNTINIASTAFSNINLGNAIKSGTDPVAAANSQTIFVVTPTQLVVTSISPSTPYAGSTGFSVTVQSQDGTGTLANAVANTSFTLSTNGNAGTIGGTVTGTILAGTSSITVTGVTLSTPGTGATVTATRTSGDALTAGTSSAFNVIALPAVAISNTAPSGANVASSAANVVLQRYDLTVTNNPATLTGFTITTAGTVVSADLTNLKCWYSTSTTFSSGTATLLSTKTTSLGAGSQVFPTFVSQTLPVGTGYIYVTATIAASPTLGHTINVATNAFSNFSLGVATTSGTDPVAAGNSFTITNASDPSPFNLSTGSYSFTSWPSTSTAGTYPSNMIFHFMDATDPQITAAGVGDYTIGYGFTSSTRISGQGVSGVSFVNTSGSNSGGPTTTIGEAVLGLNSTNRNNIRVSWKAGTIASQTRVYKLSAQYRIGTSGSYTYLPNTTVSQVEYTSSSTGDSLSFGPITLPSSCDNQPVVQVRWIYNAAPAGSSTRPELRLDDVTVTANATPTFNGGTSQNLTVCQNDINASINSLMAITDQDAGQTETWTVLSGPSHGSLSGFSATATSSGSSVSPGGLSYTPTSGYSGTDTFTIQVSDGFTTATTRINVTVNPSPTTVSVSGSGSFCGSTPTITATNGGSGTIYFQGTTSGGTSTATPSVSQVISSTGTCYFRAQSSSGCWSTEGSALVTINPVPSVTSANNDGPICEGATLGLSVTGASNVTGYLWNGPVAITSSTSSSASVPSATTSASGIYTLTVNNGTGTGCTATYTTTATVNAFPSLTSANNDGPICAGTTLGLSVSGASNVTDYLWTGPVAITTSTSASASVPSATTAASGTYTVTVNNGTGRGCTTSYTTAATVNAFPSLTSANNDGPICAGTTLGLSVTGASNVTDYLWTGPVSITSATSASASVPSATTAASGSYTVTVNNGTGRGCTTSYTTAATVNSFPSLTSANNDGPICAGTTLGLSVSGASNVTGYMWTGPVSITSATSASATVPSATTAASGTYTVAVNNGIGRGCTATYTTSATVNPAPSLTSANNDGPICAGTTLGLSVTGASNVTDYLWTGPVAITSSTSASASVPSATTAANGTYTVTVNNGTDRGCTASYTTSATVNAFPSLTSANNDGPICAGTTLGLSVTGASNVTGYLWRGPVAITTSTSASASVPSAATTASGTYTVTVSNGTGRGCSDTYTTTAVVSPAPSLTSATNDGPICAGTTLGLTANGASNVTDYLWSGPVSVTSATTSSASVPSATTSASGTYTVTVNNGTGRGCSARYTTAATVNAFPSLTSANNDGPICSGTTLGLSVTGASNVTGYLWNGPVAITNSTSSSAHVSAATTAATGVYSVTINNGTGRGCIDVYTTSATVNPLPAAVTVTGGGTFCNSTTINASNGGDGTIYFQGTTSGGTSTATPVTSALITSTGTYYFRALSSAGCWGPQGSTTVNIPSISGPSGVCLGLTINLSVVGASGGTWSSSDTSVASVNTTTGVVSGITVGTANISYTLTTGCVITKSIISTTVPPAITGPSMVCVGQTITLANSLVGGTWSSSAPTIAGVGASTGIVNGIAGGFTPTITYTLGPSCKAYATITVNPLSVISGPSSVCQGQTITLTNATAGGTWSTSSSSLATIGATTGIVSGVSNGTAIISYILPTGCTATMALPVGPLSPIIGPTSICQGQVVTLTDLVPGGTWFTSTPTIASVSASGVVTGIAGGLSATISYYFSTGCVATTVVSVNAASAISGASGICQGSTVTLTNATSGGVWLTSNASIVTIGSANGIATGVASGTSIVSYVLPSGCYSTTVASVYGVSPITGPGSVCVGQTISLANAIAGGTWSSGSPTIATVGSTGIVTGIAGGLTANISYSYGSGCRATTTITVNALGTISGPANVCQGQSVTLSSTSAGGTWSSSNSAVASVGSLTGIVTGGTVAIATISYTMPTTGCVATTTISVGTTTPITGPSTVCAGQTISLSDITPGGTWSSSAPTVASIGSTGTVLGIGSNLTTNITYTISSTCKVSKTITVNALAAISGATSVCQNLTTTLTDAAAGGVWSSSDNAVATIGSATHIVTGVSTGTATISYVMPTGCTATAPITVNDVPAIAGPSSVCQGQTVTLTESIPGGVWSTNTPSVATISSGGVVTGVAANLTGNITYTFPSACKAYATINVNALQPIAGATSVCQGLNITLTDAIAGGAWSSSNGNASIVAGTGVLTGVTAGTTTISYTLPSGCITSTPVLINPRVAITGASSSVCVGATLALSNAVAGGVWSSPTPTIASVGSTGTVTGVAGGLTVNISYTMGSGCRSTYIVSVNSIPAVPTITGASSVSVSGASITLTGSPLAGLWSSSNVAKATVVAGTGVVSGVAVGSAIITYTVSNAAGCQNFGTKVITVGPAPQAHTTINRNTVSIMTGTSANLNETVAGGIWENNDAGIAQVDQETGIVTGIAPGVAYITYTTTNGIDITSTITAVTVSHQTESIATQNAIGSLNIAPNPNKGEFNVSGRLTSIADENVVMEVTNMLGQVVYKGAIKTTAGKINEQIVLGNNLVNGNYILNIHSDTEHYVYHFVLDK